MIETIRSPCQLVKTAAGGWQLVRHGEPFLILGGELHNSSSSSAGYMRTLYPGLKRQGFNTVFAAVSWEQIEPEQGRFDFVEFDAIVRDCRASGLHIIVLWFGSFKNGDSSYVPLWIKRDAKRFPRACVKDKQGLVVSKQTLSVFAESNVIADAEAYTTLIQHLAELDAEHGTVLMVQVENEVGLTGSSRDHSPAAETAFQGQVPAELVDRLHQEYDTLHPILRRSLEHFYEKKDSSSRAGSWTEVFGEAVETDELFMAFHYARYLEQITAAGKRYYDIPMYTNAWLSSVDLDTTLVLPPILATAGGALPGVYPSGGPVVGVLDIWQLFAPSLDFISPDIYLHDYSKLYRHYLHRGQALLIPEQRRDPSGLRRLWDAYGSCGALCAAPFGIDPPHSCMEDVQRHLSLLNRVGPYILKLQADRTKGVGFYFDELPQGQAWNADVKSYQLGKWKVSICRHGLYVPTTTGHGLVVQLDEDRFLCVGAGYSARFALEDQVSGIARVTEVEVVPKTGELVPRRRLNGDETLHHSCVQMASLAVIEPDAFDIAQSKRPEICEVELWVSAD